MVIAGDVAMDIIEIFKKHTTHAFLLLIQKRNAELWEDLLARHTMVEFV